MHAININLHKLRFASRRVLGEQSLLLVRRRELSSLLNSESTSLIPQTEIRDRPLSRPARGAIRFDERPIGFSSTIASSAIGS